MDQVKDRDSTTGLLLSRVKDLFTRSPVVIEPALKPDRQVGERASRLSVMVQGASHTPFRGPGPGETAIRGPE